MSNVLPEKPLGFCELPTRKFIFIGGTDGDDQSGQKFAWYSLSADGKQVGIPHYGLRGIITGLKIVRKDYKGKANFKLDIQITADKQYGIRSGIDTTFTRGFILALHQYVTDTGEVTEPFTIGVRPGDDDKVIFSSLFNNEDTYIKYEWDGDCKLGPIVHELQKAFGQDPEVDNCEECRPSALQKRSKK